MSEYDAAVVGDRPAPSRAAKAAFGLALVAALSYGFLFAAGTTFIVGSATVLAALYVAVSSLPADRPTPSGAARAAWVAAFALAVLYGVVFRAGPTFLLLTVVVFAVLYVAGPYLAARLRE